MIPSLTQKFERTMGINVSNVARLNMSSEGWDRIAETFNSVRVSFGWNGIEPSKGVYTFEAADEIVDECTSRGISVLFILSYGNALYSASSMHPPLTGEAWDAWEAYVTEVVTRYKDKRVFYEIWNEPHGNFWKPAPQPELAGSFVAKTCRVIRNVNKHATIITGGGAALLSGKRGFVTASWTEPWLDDYYQRYFRSGGSADADYVSIHPYTLVTPSENARMEIERIAKLGRKPLVVTEIGYSMDRVHQWHNHGYPVQREYIYTDEEESAKQFVRFMAWASSVGIPCTYWFHYDDFFIDPFLNYVNFKQKNMTVKKLSYADSVATLVSTGPHGLANDDWVTIVGSKPSAFDGSYKITKVDETSFTYTPYTVPSPVVASGNIVWRSYGYARGEDTYGLCEERDTHPFTFVGGKASRGTFDTSLDALETKSYINDVEVIGAGAFYEDPEITFCGVANVDPEQAVGQAILSDAGAVTGVRLGKLGAELLTTATTWDYPTVSGWSGDNTDGFLYTPLETVPGPVTATTLVSEGALATFTKVDHGFTTGQSVVISGSSDTEFNKATPVEITVVSDDVFTYPITPATYLEATVGSDGVIATCTAPGHTFKSGDVVTISGANDAYYNGDKTVVTADATTFTFAIDALAADVEDALITVVGKTIVAAGTIVATYTDRLTNTYYPTVDNTMYRVDILIIGRTAGSITVSLGNDSIAGVTADKSWFPTCTEITSDYNFTVTPTADFDGTVRFSLKLMPDDTTTGHQYIDFLGGGTAQKVLKNAYVTFDDPPEGGVRAEAWGDKLIFDYYGDWTYGTGWEHSRARPSENVNGFQHTTGNVEALTSKIALEVGVTYVFALYMSTNPTAGKGLTITAGGLTLANANEATPDVSDAEFIDSTLVGSGQANEVFIVERSIPQLELTALSTDALTITPDTDFNGKFVVYMWVKGAESVRQCNVWRGGSGYTLAPNVKFSEPAILPRCKAILMDGMVQGVEIVDHGAYPNTIALGQIQDPGQPYQIDYRIAIEAPSGADPLGVGRAADLLVLTNVGPDVVWPQRAVAHLRSVLVRDKGNNYENPVITCGNKPVQEPVLRAWLKGGKVTDIKILNPGGGFLPKAVESITDNVRTATVTTVDDHGYSVGDAVIISGSTVLAYNGTFYITEVPTTKTFKYVMSSVPGSNAAGTITCEVLVPKVAIAAATTSALTGASGTWDPVTRYATITKSNHGLVNGDSVLISGGTGTTAGYNGTFVVHNCTTNTFKYTLDTLPTANGTGLTVAGQAVLKAQMGHIRLAEAPKLGYYAANQMRRLLDGYTFVEDASTDPNHHEIVFTNGTSNVVVLWAEKLVPAIVKTWLDSERTLHIATPYPGFGYVTAPAVRWVDGPEGLAGTAKLDCLGSYTDGFNDLGMRIINSGSGYTSAPDMRFVGGGTPTRKAKGIVYVSNGRIISAQMHFLGQSNRGYTSRPDIELVGGGGKNAKIECMLNAIGTIELTGNTGLTYPYKAYLEGGFPTYSVPDTVRGIYRYDGTILPVDTEVIDITEDPIYVVYDL